ncbi:polyketide synthase PksN domain protein [Gracilaria domingensis]|nr:polyketide synthase PksN domain protein [Gracilaria domingensis]
MAPRCRVARVRHASGVSPPCWPLPPRAHVARARVSPRRCAVRARRVAGAPRLLTASPRGAPALAECARARWRRRHAARRGARRARGPAPVVKASWRPRAAPPAPPRRVAVRRECRRCLRAAPALHGAQKASRVARRARAQVAVGRLFAAHRRRALARRRVARRAALGVQRAVLRRARSRAGAFGRAAARAHGRAHLRHGLAQGRCVRVPVAGRRVPIGRRCHHSVQDARRLLCGLAQSRARRRPAPPGEPAAQYRYAVAQVCLRSQSARGRDLHVLSVANCEPHFPTFRLHVTHGNASGHFFAQEGFAASRARARPGH